MAEKIEVGYDLKKFVSVHHLAYVKNVEKALATIKGEEGITKVYNNHNLRLALNFEPNDLYRKPAHADRFNTTNLLMKVVTRTITQPDGTKTVERQAQFLGPIIVTYKFSGMVDYQTLPFTRNKEGPGYVSLLPDLVPSGLPNHTWLQEKVEKFMVPFVFSRSDQPQKVNFSDSAQSALSRLVVDPSNLSQSTRLRVVANAHVMYFEHEGVPSTPTEEALKVLERKLVDSQLLELMKQKFEERPVWSRDELLHQTAVAHSKLKNLLPAVSYYFSNGPWRGTWIRLGYDPRKDPSAKPLQTLDFRFRNSANMELDSIPFKRTAFQQQKVHSRSACQMDRSMLGANPGPSTADASTPHTELLYKFKIDQLPCYRQTLYQLRNIEVAEVQALVHLNDGQETTCHEKDGWCLPRTLEKCRSILYSHIQALMAQAREQGKEPQNFLDDNVELLDRFGIEGPDEGTEA